MICVLKHKKSSKYISHALGKLVGSPHYFKWDMNTATVQFKLTSNLLEARKIENPNMRMVLAFGLEAIPIKLTKAKLEPAYRIFEHDKEL